MSDSLTFTMLRALLFVSWQYGYTALIIVSVLAILITFLTIGHKKFGTVALIINIYPGFCFVVIAIAKIYDSFHIPMDLQRAIGVNFLSITWLNFVAECFFVWALKYRHYLTRGVFARLVGVISSVAFFVSLFVEIDHA